MICSYHIAFITHYCLYFILNIIPIKLRALLLIILLSQHNTQGFISCITMCGKQERIFRPYNSHSIIIGATRDFKEMSMQCIVGNDAYYETAWIGAMR